MLKLSPFQSDHQAWQVPEDVADVLPGAAQKLEALRSQFLQLCQRWGYAQVQPPLIGYLPSLLCGATTQLHQQTFRLVDLHSGLDLGVRADATPQVARIDAHLLQHSGITRLCYAVPVLHTRAEKPHGTREPLQFGAELYGSDTIQSDGEVLELALQCLRLADLPALQLDLAHVGVVRALLDELHLPVSVQQELHTLLAAKDRAGLSALCAQDGGLHTHTGLNAERLNALHTQLLQLCDLHGTPMGREGVLQRARALQHASAQLALALDELTACVEHVQAQSESVTLSVDLADMQGYGYYTGMRFAVYAQGAADSIARGGRYDAIGAVFGRQRPAVGFSLDLKALLSLATQTHGAAREDTLAAIAAPWLTSDIGGAAHTRLQQRVAELRAAGHNVLFFSAADHAQLSAAVTLPGFKVGARLVPEGDTWLLQTLA